MRSIGVLCGLLSFSACAARQTPVQRTARMSPATYVTANFDAEGYPTLKVLPYVEWAQKNYPHLAKKKRVKRSQLEAVHDAYDRYMAQQIIVFNAALEVKKLQVLDAVHD